MVLLNTDNLVSSFPVRVRKLSTYCWATTGCQTPGYNYCIHFSGLERSKTSKLNLWYWKIGEWFPSGMGWLGTRRGHGGHVMFWGDSHVLLHAVCENSPAAHFVLVHIPACVLYSTKPLYNGYSYPHSQRRKLKPREGKWRGISQQVSNWLKPKSVRLQSQSLDYFTVLPLWS